MSFIPKDLDRGKIVSLPMGASAVGTKWGLMKMSSGYLVAGASGDNEVEYIALETYTEPTGVAGGANIDVIRIDDEIVFDATCGTEPVQATHVGNDYDIASVSTIDLTATTDKVFHIDEIINATDKIVRGHFNKPALA